MKQRYVHIWANGRGHALELQDEGWELVCKDGYEYIMKRPVVTEAKSLRNMVMIDLKELEALREEAWMYDELD